MEKSVRLPEGSELTQDTIDRIDQALRSFPPENALDYYERHLCTCNHGHLSPNDQEAALSVLKLLQSLN